MRISSSYLPDHHFAIAIAAALGYCACEALHRRRRQVAEAADASQSSAAARFAHAPLAEAEMPAEPCVLLRAWIDELDDGGPCYVVLATSSASEGATARTLVLQRLLASGGLLVGSSAESLKARQLADDVRAEAVLRWGHRQVRVRGRMREGSAEETADSFRLQLKGFRLGLPMLQQGQPIDEAGHVALRARYDAAASRCKGALGDSAPNSPPSGYSAYVLEPACVEFYSGGHPGCINDRFLYVREGDATWTRTRLQA